VSVFVLALSSMTDRVATDGIEQTVCSVESRCSFWRSPGAVPTCACVCGGVMGSCYRRVGILCVEGLSVRERRV